MGCDCSSHRTRASNTSPRTAHGELNEHQHLPSFANLPDSGSPLLTSLRSLRRRRGVVVVHRLELDADGRDVVAVVALLLTPLGRGRLDQLRHLFRRVVRLGALRLREGRGGEGVGAGWGWLEGGRLDGGAARRSCGRERAMVLALVRELTLLRILHASSLSMNSQTPSDAMTIISSLEGSMSKEVTWRRGSRGT